ncbi:MAG TPA: alpha/beta hydrolase [Limnobacter sp.]|nr:alpha/beta hydrolase [Limnobacter sp.]
MQLPTCITVPGLNGSGPDHWQTWAENQIPNCRRVKGIDFNKPVIAAWADAIRKDIRSEAGSVILIAHSFGCLASVLAVANNDIKVAGLILVAPASPQRFNAAGLVQGGDLHLTGSLMNAMPTKPLGVPGLLIASTNDPWMKITQARYWADQWGFCFSGLRNAGHINVDSGFGQWPALQHLVRRMREDCCGLPLGTIHIQNEVSTQRFDALTKMRWLTRNTLNAL